MFSLVVSNPNSNTQEQFTSHFAGSRETGFALESALRTLKNERRTGVQGQTLLLVITNGDSQDPVEAAAEAVRYLHRVYAVYLRLDV